VKVAGQRSFAVPREVVWAVLNDPAKMAELMPGVQSFEVTDDRHWRANVKVPLGLGSLAMSIDFEKTKEREPEFASLRAKGNGVGAILGMETSFRLAEEGATTKMDWEADVSIAGPVGSMGQRVLQPIVKQQVSHVLNALDAQVTAAASDTPPSSRPAPAGAAAAGAETGIHPASPEAYSDEPEGPTQSTED
jgi:carbon monoxide dehydrogenase subunit G